MGLRAAGCPVRRTWLKTVAWCPGLGGEGSEAGRKWQADGGKELPAPALDCGGTWGSEWVGRRGLSAPSQHLMV